MNKELYMLSIWAGNSSSCWGFVVNIEELNAFLDQMRDMTDNNIEVNGAYNTYDRQKTTAIFPKDGLIYQYRRYWLGDKP